MLGDVCHPPTPQWLPAPCPQSCTGLLQVQSAYDLLTEVGDTGPWGAESPCASPRGGGSAGLCGGHKGWPGLGRAGAGGLRGACRPRWAQARRPSPWQRSPWQRWAGRALRPRRAELTSHKKSRPGSPSARSLRAGAQHHTSPSYWLVAGLAAPSTNRARPLPLLQPIAGRGRAAAGSVRVRCVRGPRAPRSCVAAEGRLGRGGLRGIRWEPLGSFGIRWDLHALVPV